ncbi:MAG: hypothetical protein JOY82_10025 [Streptosporangiaceae bacterium]|nr:hypothetical protein [Streptosporangiaceae bacterium]MBV9854847.1 hypothetical protein [Streptosporangiaceae bacterium]
MSLLAGGLIAVGACWLACYGIHAGALRAFSARRVRRAEKALHAEVTCGIARIERFLQEKASGTIRRDSPDADVGDF